MKTLFKILITLVAMSIFFACDLFEDDDIEYGTVTQEIYNAVSEMMSEIPLNTIESNSTINAAYSDLESSYTGSEITASGSATGLSYTVTYNGRNDSSAEVIFTYSYTDSTYTNDSSNTVTYSGDIEQSDTFYTDYTVDYADEPVSGTYMYMSTDLTIDLTFTGTNFETISGNMFISMTMTVDQNTAYDEAYDADDTVDQYEYSTMSFSGTITVDGTNYRVSDMEEYFLADWGSDD